MGDAAERLKWWAKDHQDEGMATAEVKVADLQAVLRERDGWIDAARIAEGQRDDAERQRDEALGREAELREALERLMRVHDLVNAPEHKRPGPGEIEHQKRHAWHVARRALAAGEEE